MNTPRACHATLTHAELTAALRALADAWPDLLELQEIGRSREGREIWAVTVGDRRPASGGPETVPAPPAPGASSPDRHPVDQRPALYMDGNIHACELTGSTACLALLHALCEGSSTEAGAALLRRVTFYLVPRVSPDGAEHYLATGEYVRSSPRLYPHEDPAPGLHAKDLDGDGLVFQMRLADPAGGWRISKQDPRVMVRRTPRDLEGPFYRVYAEGLFHDYDGHVLKVAPRARGLDFNRNFPAAWRPEKEQKGAGPFPLSEPETRAVAAFIRAHPNIGIFLALHTGIEVLLPPEGSHPWTDYSEEDRVLLSQLAAPALELLKIPFDSLFPVDYGKIHGDFSEWMFEHLGIPGFVAELWSPAARAGASLKDQIQAGRGFTDAESSDLAVARWLDDRAIPDQLRPWREFAHPQLGRLELGGWRQGFFSRAPDGPILEEIGVRVADYAKILARALPRLELREVDVSELAPGLFRVGVTVVNGGMMDTNLTRMAISQGVAKEVVAQLELLPGTERLVGPERQKLGHLEGYGGMARAEWLVRAPDGGEVRIRVESEKAGQASRQVRLGR